VPTRTLNADEARFVHDTLVRDFAEAADPIFPAGVRSIALLQSAVGRQHTGIGQTLKYPNPIENAATLLFGLCNDHPFHNGNKRTALVCALVHLDKNKLSIFGTSQSELYDFMLSVASHSIVRQPRRRSRRRKPTADEEVVAITKWLTSRVAPIKRGERHITYRELRRILEDFGFVLENLHDNAIDIVKYISVKKGLLRREVTERHRFCRIGWPGENREIGIGAIKKVRKACGLCEEDGVDSEAFYNQYAIVDSFVNRYRTVLRRLART
jgi:death on curing protein